MATANSRRISPAAGPGLTRRTVLRTGLAGGALIFAPGALAACATSAGPGASRSTSTALPSVIAGIGNPPQTKWDPALALGIIETSVNNHMHEALVNLDPPTRALSPGLATALPRATGTSVTVSLRDAKFHDGSPVTADDVQFSFQRIKDPKLVSPLAGFLSDIKDISVQDDTTVVFTLTSPVTYLADRLSLVKILPKHAFADGGTSFQAHPIGCGPYQYVAYQTNDHVTLKEFSGYSGARKHGPENVTIRIMTDDNARLAALVGNQINMMDDVPYQNVGTLQKNSAMKTQSVLSNNATLMIFHTGKKPFHDKRVRQAFLYAIDRTEISKDVFLGDCTAATSVLSAAHPDYVRPSHVYSYNPDLAKQLLAQAGYPNGLDLTLYIPPVGYLTTEGPDIQAAAAKAGFRLTLKSDATFDVVTNGTFEVFFGATDPSVFGYDADVLLRYLYVGSLASQFMRWHDSESAQVASLMDQASKTTDTARQKELWGHVQEIISDAVPAYPIHFVGQVSSWDVPGMSWYKPLPAAGCYFAGEEA